MALWPATAVKVGLVSVLTLAGLTGTAEAATSSPSHTQTLPAAFSKTAHLGNGPGNPFAPKPHPRLPAHPVTQVSTAPKAAPKPAPPPPPTPPVTVYDSANPAAIPTNAPAVAGYVTGPYAWPQSQWQRFPTTKKITIDIIGGDTHAMVEDVEPGGVPASDLRTWALARQAQGQTPIVYSSISDYQTQVLPALQGIHFDWWSADPSGFAHGVPGSDGTQYFWGGQNYDISLMNSYVFPKA